MAWSVNQKAALGVAVDVVLSPPGRKTLNELSSAELLTLGKAAQNNGSSTTPSTDPVGDSAIVLKDAFALINYFVQA